MIGKYSFGAAGLLLLAASAFPGGGQDAPQREVVVVEAERFVLVERDGAGLLDVVPRSGPVEAARGARAGNGTAGPSGGGIPGPILPPPLPPAPFCAPQIADQALPGSTLTASSVPVIGRLFPLGPDLFVDPLGRVGIGTLLPAARLHVEGGDLNVRDGALRVRGSDTSAPLELGTSASEPRPHLSDGFTTILGGAAPEATFATGDYSLGSTEPTLGAHLEIGAGGAGGKSLLQAEGPTGAGLELFVGGPGHDLDAHVGAGAGRWIATADGLSGSTLFDGGTLDGDGRFEVRDPGGAAAVELDASWDAIGGGGAELTLDNDQGDEVVRILADSLGGASLALGEPAGPRLDLGAGNSAGAGAGLAMYEAGGSANLLLQAEGAAGGGELSLFDSQGRQTVLLQAASSSSTVPALLRLLSYAKDPTVPFVAAELSTPETGKSPILKLVSKDGSAVTLLGQSGPGSSGGGLVISDTNGVVRAEMYDNVFTLFDDTGDATIVHDGNAGTKSAVVRTAAGPRKVYCSEAAEVWFEDAGVARLRDGRAEIELDPVYLQTVVIDAEHPLHASASPRGASPGVWIEKRPDRIVLHELEGGSGDGWVDWRVQARRVGLEDARLEPFHR